MNRGPIFSALAAMAVMVVGAASAEATAPVGKGNLAKAFRRPIGLSKAPPKARRQKVPLANIPAAKKILNQAKSALRRAAQVVRQVIKKRQSIRQTFQRAAKEGTITRAERRHIAEERARAAGAAKRQQSGPSSLSQIYQNAARHGIITPSEQQLLKKAQGGQ